MKVVALSYTRNQFWLHTVWKGKAYEYLVFLDGNTIKVLPLKEEPTEEPNGTRVVVQLKKEWNEVDKWKDAIKQQCAYFDGTVIDIEGKKEVVMIEKNNFVWKSSLYKEETHLILGSVYYDIPWSKLSEWSVVKDLNIGIHFDLTEGITPVPSREAWEFNETSKELLISKFKTILEQIWIQCEKELTEIQTKSNIEKLKFVYEGKLSLCSMSQYKTICSTLGKLPIEIVVADRIKGNERSLFGGLKDSFKGTGVYCQNWTPLKREYVHSLGKSCAERTNVKFDLFWSITIPQTDGEYRRKVAEQLKEEFLNEWIDFHYTKFDDIGFEQWKKNRKSEKKVNKGVVYYRAHVNDPNQCTKDKGNIDLSTYRIIFKATENTAKRHWTFLNRIFKNFIITKDYGMNLNNLEPSPLLRRMCSESFKIKVYNILGQRTNDMKIREIIKELNPLLAQYLIQIPLKEGIYNEVQQALMEVGEKFKCFDKDEVKLKYMEHHLKLMEICKYVGHKEYSYSNLKITDREIELIKRHYFLERLAEKKWKEEEEQSVNTNQLEIQFN